MTDALVAPDAPLGAVDTAAADTAADTTADTETSPERARVDILREAIDEARVVMLTAEHEGLHSRPLTLLNVDQAGGLWFLVDGGEPWVEALVERPMVDVSIDLHADGRWVSVSGVAVLSDDRVAIRELWTPAATAFWESVDDARIRVLRVDPSVVDVWRSAPSAIGRVLAIGKAVLTGETDDLGEHDHLVFAES
jgi:general stress protein 26